MTQQVTSPAQPVARPYLEFKYLVNVMLGDLGDGVYYQVPTEMTNTTVDERQVIDGRPTRYGEQRETNCVTTPSFNMDFTHRILLNDERPVKPKRPKDISDAFYSKLCDAAYRLAAEAKLANDAIRERVNHYASQNVLEIVSDPFDGEWEVEGLGEIAATYTPAPLEPVEIKPRTIAA
jgi:hypothetical protein